MALGVKLTKPHILEATLSTLVKEFIDDNDHDDDNTNGKMRMPLSKVETDCLVKIVEFMIHHHHTEPLEEIVMPPEEDEFDKIMIRQPWYGNFVNVSDEMLYKLVQASNYMGIRE